MAFFVDKELHGAGGDAALSAPPREFLPEPSPAGGATSGCDDPHALYLRDDAEIYVKHYRGLKAKMFIPCASNRCGGRMALHILDKQNNPIPRPFYRCEREGCTYREEILFPDEMRGEYVREDGKKRYRQTDEGVTRREAETMV